MQDFMTFDLTKAIANKKSLVVFNRLVSNIVHASSIEIQYGNFTVGIERCEMKTLIFLHCHREHNVCRANVRWMNWSADEQFQVRRFS